MRSESIAVEEPLEIRHAGKPLITVMRSPGDDEELCRGLLLSEGFASGPDVILAISRPADASLRREERGNVLDVELSEAPRIESRAQAVATSCGVCGKRAIAELEIRAQPVASNLRVQATVIAALPEALRAAQPTFHETGAVHAAGLFTQNGKLVIAREDVGRHNAVDKVLGWAAQERTLPLSDHVLCVSGRAGFEIVQKAVLAGVPVVAAVSAPTSLAIDVAERFRVTLCGFVRGGSFNVYSHRARIENPR